MPSSQQDVWTIRSALEWTRGYLGRHGDEHPRLSAEWLISDATGLGRVELYVNFDRPLSTDERAKLRMLVERRGRGEPLQYVTGDVGFRHIVVRVEPGVLIPRPETEMLVEVALGAVDHAIEARGAAHVLDLCTGSGVVALSIVHERGSADAVGTDIEPKAVKLAQRNAEALGLDGRASFIECDLALGLPAADAASFDLVVSNPPYIPTAELAELPREVADFEPRLALDGGEDGLDVFRRIADDALGLLAPGGMLCCELHEDNIMDAAAYCEKGYCCVEVTPDLAGRKRILSALLPSPGEA